MGRSALPRLCRRSRAHRHIESTVRCAAKGKVWEEESFDRILRREENIGDKLDYILWNPVGAGLVRNPLEYRWRSEEHTSELQSLTNLVCRLLLEKKKQ